MRTAEGNKYRRRREKHCSDMDKNKILRFASKKKKKKKKKQTNKQKRKNRLNAPFPPSNSLHLGIHVISFFLFDNDT
jgi:hypothetical protein